MHLIDAAAATLVIEIYLISSFDVKGYALPGAYSLLTAKKARPSLQRRKCPN
jgi:hypothetical protein